MGGMVVLPLAGDINNYIALLTTFRQMGLTLFLTCSVRWTRVNFPVSLALLIVRKGSEEPKKSFLSSFLPLNWSSSSSLHVDSSSEVTTNWLPLADLVSNAAFFYWNCMRKSRHRGWSWTNIIAFVTIPDRWTDDPLHALGHLRP